MSATAKCRHCGVRVRFVAGRWAHSWENWQYPLGEDGHHAEPGGGIMIWPRRRRTLDHRLLKDPE
jgi:hypothetical protein